MESRLDQVIRVVEEMFGLHDVKVWSETIAKCGVAP
jgi:hypothetical protein